MQQFLKDYGALLIFAVQIVGTGVMLWFSRTVATKRDIDAMNARIEQLEAANENAPDATDIASLRLEMSHHVGQMREFSAAFNGKCETLDAKFAGLDGLLQRVDAMASMLTRHLLDRGQ